MKVSRAILTPSRHKIILSLSPFIVALILTFFHMGGGQSNYIPFFVIFPLLGLATLLGGILTGPVKLLLPLEWEIAHGGKIYPPGEYIIAAAYALLIYLLLSWREAKKQTLYRTSASPQTVTLASLTFTTALKKSFLRFPISKIILMLLPFLLAFSFTFLEIVFKLDSLSYPPQLDFIGAGAFGITIFFSLPLSAPFEPLFSPLGLWDKWTSMPNHFGIYLVAISYSIVIYVLTSLFNAFNKYFRHRTNPQRQV